MYRNLYDLCLASAVILFIVFVFSTAVGLATAPPKVCIDGFGLPTGVASGHIDGVPYWRCALNRDMGLGGVCKAGVEGKACDYADYECKCRDWRNPGDDIGTGDCKCM